MKCSAISLAGKGRNLDRYFINEGLNIFAVLDGTTSGDEFSELFVDWLLELIKERIGRMTDPPYYYAQEKATFLRRMVKEADEEIPKRMSKYYGDRINPAAFGVGSTLAIVHLTHFMASNWIVVNSGDSQVLLIRDKKVLQLSYDDTQFNQWVEDGSVVVINGKPQYRRRGDIVDFGRIKVSSLEVSRSIDRMIRWVGNGAEPHIRIEPAKPGDILIIWTDGAKNLVDHYLTGRNRSYSVYEKKLAQAAIAVAKGKVEHLLAATPFWDTYNPREKLGDDSTVLVVYDE